MLLDGQACGRNDHVAGYMFGQSLHAYDKGGGMSTTADNCWLHQLP